MKLGIMQPYFFPYIGYFDLINRVDRWVVFDTVQYRPRSWMNRNRILHPQDGCQYVTVPVSYHRDTLIKEVRINDPAAVRKSILGKLTHYKRQAPFYRPVTEIVDRCFDRLESDHLSHLNINTLVETCRYLEIDFDYGVLSEMDLQLPEIREPGQWALEIANRLHADEYINPNGGKEIFKDHEWREKGIRLTFTEMPNLTYNCGGYDFISNLSILDVLMWNSPLRVKRYLDR